MLTLGATQLLSYDTTFQLGDFYVSPLIFRHTIFEEKPCIPATFLIHERKYTATHQEMFKECVAQIPALRKATCPLFIDKEQAITNAAKLEMQSVPLVHCWNHIVRDIQHVGTEHLHRTFLSIQGMSSGCCTQLQKPSMRHSLHLIVKGGMQPLRSTSWRRSIQRLQPQSGDGC